MTKLTDELIRRSGGRVKRADPNRPLDPTKPFDRAVVLVRNGATVREAKAIVLPEKEDGC